MIGAAGAFGGLAARRPDQFISPSTALPPPPPSTQVPFLTIVGPTGRLLVYNPAKVTGDLLASIAAHAFNDGLPGGGNNVLQGITSYTPGGTGLAPIVQINNGTIQLWPLAPGSAGLVNPALIGINGATGNDALGIQAPQNTGHNQAALLLQSAFPNAQVELFGLWLFGVQSNTPVAPPAGFLQMYGAPLGTGAGTIIADAPMGVLGTLTQVTGTIAAPALETWHNMVLLANFAAGTPTPQYQLEPINGGRVRLRGQVNVTGANVAGTSFTTLPAGYTFARDHFFPCAASAALTNNGFTIKALGGTGSIQCVLASANGQVISLDGVVIDQD